MSKRVIVQLMALFCAGLANDGVLQADVFASKCSDMTANAYDTASCRACIRYQVVGKKCGYDPTTGTCRLATKGVQYVRRCPALFPVAVDMSGNACAQSPCLEEIQSNTVWDPNNVVAHADLIWDQPTIITTCMYKDHANYVCRTASNTAIQTAASLQGGLWPLMAAGYSGNAATERANHPYYIKGGFALRHDDRAPRTIFRVGFAAGSVDANHPARADCNGGAKQFGHDDLAVHQINNDRTTYCNLISTTTCVGVGFLGEDWTYAVVVPEGYDFIRAWQAEGYEDANSELMALRSIPNTHVYAARKSDIADLDFDDTRPLEGTVNGANYKPHYKTPKPYVVLNPNFNVVLTNAEHAALQALLHVQCNAAGAAACKVY